MQDVADPPWLSERCGPAVAPDQLSAAKARELAAFLNGRDDVGARVIELRENDGRSWLVIEVEVDVGQAPVVDIERRERLAIGFREDDAAWPTALALRPSFPKELLHTFLVGLDDPAALCLSEEPWDEFKRRWTPYQLIRMIRRWLIETARGELHAADQPLEPFVIGSALQAILPARFAQATKGENKPLYGYIVEGNGLAETIRFFDHPRHQGKQPGFAAATFLLPKQRQDFIRHAPRNLDELQTLFTVDGFDFRKALDDAVRNWLAVPALRDAQPVLIVGVPLARAEAAQAENTDARLFLLSGTVRELGVSLDLWSKLGGSEAPVVVARNPTLVGANIGVDLLNVSLELTHDRAAQYNGYAGSSGETYLAIGAGALGSQIIGNLVRIGEKIVGVADDDRLLPHNQVRHGTYASSAVGFSKARVVAEDTRGFLDSPIPCARLVVNALNPAGEDADAYRRAAAESSVILDMAASVAAARHLAIDLQNDGRRISAFLSPSGHDLVVLAEDKARAVRLDHLELAYYAAVAVDTGLEGHLTAPAGIRYAQSCRDVSARIAQPFVALHAGIAAHAIRGLAAKDDAFGAVWRVDPQTMEVRRLKLDSRPFSRHVLGDWTVLVAPGLLDVLATRRTKQLPSETGGVLLGDFDTSRKLIYLAGTLEAPLDSKETSGSFIRGAHGLREAVTEVETRTQSMLRYVGEWHSHPDGYGVRPSGDDIGLYRYMAEEMDVEGYPPVMLIVGDNEFSLIVAGTRSPLDWLGAS